MKDSKMMLAMAVVVAVAMTTSCASGQKGKARQEEFVRAFEEQQKLEEQARLDVVAEEGTRPGESVRASEEQQKLEEQGRLDAATANQKAFAAEQRRIEEQRRIKEARSKAEARRLVQERKRMKIAFSEKEWADKISASVSNRLSYVRQRVSKGEKWFFKPLKEPVTFQIGRASCRERV